MIVLPKKFPALSLTEFPTKSEFHQGPQRTANTSKLTNHNVLGT